MKHPYIQPVILVMEIENEGIIAGLDSGMTSRTYNTTNTTFTGQGINTQSFDLSFGGVLESNGDDPSGSAWDIAK